MKKVKKINKNIPAYAFGLESIAGAAVPLLSNFGGQSDVASGLGGIASGILGGSSLGPAGMLVGGGLGLYNALKASEAKKYQIKRGQEAVVRQKTIRNQANLNAVSNEMASDFELKNPVIPTFKYGGTTNNLAYVDDSEIIQYPNGDTKKVKDNSGKTDNVLTKLPNDTTIFSDSLNVPGTRRTFAEEAEKLSKISDRKYKNNDKFSRTSRELNDKYVDKQMNKLKINQFMRKNMMGKKSNTASVPEYALGKEGDINWLTSWAQQNPDPGNITPPSFSSKVPKIPSMATNPINMDRVSSAAGTFPQKKLGETNSLSGALNGVQNVLTDYLSLSPYRYNLNDGNKPYDIVSTIDNPYSSQINRTMRARRISMQPVREALNRQRSISRTNARDLTGTGQNMAYNLASEALLNRTEADAIVNNQQINNQYAADYAGTMGSLGQQWVNATAYAEDATARNKAASAALRGAASTELKQWAQNRALMSNQQTRDKGLLDAITPFLREGYDSKTLQNILKQFS